MMSIQNSQKPIGKIGLGVFVAVLLINSAVGQQAVSVIPPDPLFADGISPSHVYTRMDLLDRLLDKLLEHKGIRLLPEDFPQEIEFRLKPRHVYQIVLTCTWRLQEFDKQSGVLQIPLISSQPRDYEPRDVFLVVNLMLENAQRIGNELGLSDLPTEEIAEKGKVPTDVFHRAVRLFVKLNALCGYRDLSPSEVYAEMIRATEDVKSILRQADPACRYYIDAPAVEMEKIPGDVFGLCLEIRQLLNQKQEQVGLERIMVPNSPARETLRPRDVFFQTQIIIAELNFLKERLQTTSSTPLAIPVTGKTATDVFREGTTLKYLLQQVKTK